jgi:uncharacterized membrane protein YsdA (DUF1294 family)
MKLKIIVTVIMFVLYTNGKEAERATDRQIRAVQHNTKLQGGSNMTGTNCDLFTHKSSRSYLNHLVLCVRLNETNDCCK